MPTYLYRCTLCDYTTKRQADYDRHCKSSKKHLLRAQGKEPERVHYYCATCRYHTGYKYSYNKHLETQKHKYAIP